MADLVGWRFTFVAMAVFAALVIIWVLTTLPFLPGQVKANRTSLGAVLKMRGLVLVLVTVLLYITGHNIIYTYIAAVLGPVGLEGQVGTILLVFGGASILSLLATGALINKHLRASLIASAILFALAMLSLVLFTILPVVVYVAAGAWGLAFGGAPSLLQTAMMRVAKDAFDAAQSVTVTVWNAGIAGGGIAGRVILSSFGSAALGWTSFFLVVAVLVIVLLARRSGYPATR